MGKSAGIDGVPNEVLKTDQVMRCLHAFFEFCFHAGYIPSEWTQGIICPIPKSKKMQLDIDVSPPVFFFTRTYM